MPVNAARSGWSTSPPARCAVARSRSSPPPRSRPHQADRPSFFVSMTCSDGLFQFPNQSAGGTNQRSLAGCPPHRPQGAIAFWGRPSGAGRAGAVDEPNLMKHLFDGSVVSVGEAPGRRSSRGSRRARDRDVLRAHALRDPPCRSATTTPRSLAHRPTSVRWRAGRLRRECLAHPEGRVCSTAGRLRPRRPARRALPGSRRRPMFAPTSRATTRSRSRSGTAWSGRPALLTVDPRARPHPGSPMRSVAAALLDRARAPSPSRRALPGHAGLPRIEPDGELDRQAAH